MIPSLSDRGPGRRPLVVPVGQFATDNDGGVDLGAADRVDGELEQSVVQQQGVTGSHIARQLLVVEADPLVGDKVLADADLLFVALKPGQP